MECLLRMDDCDLMQLMTRFQSTEEEIQRLRSALSNLKRWTGRWDGEVSSQFHETAQYHKFNLERAPSAQRAPLAQVSASFIDTPA